MRQNLTIDKALSNGLSKTWNLMNNEPVLTEALNIRPMENGAWPYTDIICPISGAELAAHGITVSWPFPQFIRGNGVTLLCTATKIFTVNESTWTLTELTIEGKEDLGRERLANHLFMSTTGWSIISAAVTIDNALAHFTGVNNAKLYQYRADMSYAIEQGHTYKVGITVNHEAGCLRVQLGTTYGQYIDKSGTFYETITCAGDNSFCVQSGAIADGKTPFVGTVSMVSVKEVSPIERLVNPHLVKAGVAPINGWQISNFEELDESVRLPNVLEPPGSYTGYILQNIGAQSQPIEVGRSYSVTYTVAMTGVGTSRIKIGSTYGTSRTASGTYTETVLASGNCAFVIECTTEGSVILSNIAVTEVLPSAVPTGGWWHFSDFGTAWFLHNGNCTIYHNPTTNKTYIVTDHTVRTGCACRGRFVTGGFASDFWSTSWKNQWYDYVPEWVDLNVSAMSMPGNAVMWSSIGGGDVFMWQYPSLGINGGAAIEGTDDRMPNMAQYMARNEYGYQVMPFQGNVLCVKTLGKGVMVYGEDGVCYMPMANAPFPTFGVAKLLSVGALSRASIGGDENVHLFIDTTGCMWRVDASLKLEKLDYSEYVIPLMNNAVSVVYDAHEAMFYIAGKILTAYKGYILTASGMSEVAQAVTGVENIQGGTLGYFVATGNDGITLTTHTLDMGSSLTKTIHAVRVVAEGSYTPTVSIGYRNKNTDSFTYTIAVSADSRGQYAPYVCGTEFRVKVAYTAHTGMKIDRIEVEWSLDGKTRLTSYLS